MLRCPVLPASGRSRFDVATPDPRLCALAVLRATVMRVFVLAVFRLRSRAGFSGPVYCVRTPRRRQRGPGSPGRCRAERADRMAWPESSCGSSGAPGVLALRSFAPACRRPGVSARPGPPAVLPQRPDPIVFIGRSFAPLSPAFGTHTRTCTNQHGHSGSASGLRSCRQSVLAPPSLNGGASRYCHGLGLLQVCGHDTSCDSRAFICRRVNPPVPGPSDDPYPSLGFRQVRCEWRQVSLPVASSLPAWGVL